jgi:TetR/AcrR family transcriptional regulator, ethionamide resistance regulator
VEGVTGATERVRRRRRTPEQAEAEIVGAAETLLRERPFRDLTVDEVMRRTELSRPSFYVYFRDRHHLVLKVVERIQTEMMAVADTWFKGGRDGPAEIRETLEQIAVAYREHGPVLQALSDAATDDERVQTVYEGMVDVYVHAVAEHIEREAAAGNALPLDAQETAKAVVWMIERYLLRELGGGDAGEARELAATETLAAILNRTIYGRDA